MADANLAAKLLPRLNKLSLQRDCNNTCEPNVLWIDDENVKLAISKKRLKTMILALNTKLTFSPAFLQQNAMLAFMCYMFQRQNEKFVSSLKLCLNTRFAPHFKNVRSAFSLRLSRRRPSLFNPKMRESCSVADSVKTWPSHFSSEAWDLRSTGGCARTRLSLFTSETWGSCPAPSGQFSTELTSPQPYKFETNSLDTYTTDLRDYLRKKRVHQITS